MLRLVDQLGPFPWLGDRPWPEYLSLLRGSVKAPPEASPTPLFSPVHQISPSCIAFHIAHDLIKVIVFLHGKRFESPLIEVSLSYLASMFLPPCHVSDRQPLHEGRQLAVLFRP